MRLYFKNKWFSLRGGSYVLDEAGNQVYKVKGKFFTWTNKKFVQDMAGNTFYVVRNKFWSFWGRKAFIMDPSQKILSTVTRKVFTLHDRYKIDSPYGELRLDGNILGFDYHISINGEEIGHVARNISFRDSFVLDLNEGYDPRYFIALIVALDNLTDQANQDTSSVTYGN